MKTIAVDWSHIKGLTIYNGKKVSVVDRKGLLKKLAGESIISVESKKFLNPASKGAGEESKMLIKSKHWFNPSAPLIILERECPLSLIYDILKVGCQVSTLLNFEVKSYREGKGIQKTDENDAIAIYELAQAKPNLLFPVSLDDAQIQLIDFYQRYKRYQKARVAMVNMKKAYIRQFGDGVKSSRAVPSTVPINNPSPATEGEGKSTLRVKSTAAFNPSLSDETLPYDIGIDTLKATENSCLKKLIKLAPPAPQSLKIKGLGPRIWAGIFITANPTNFSHLSSYLRFCGLVNRNQLGNKGKRCNLHAKMLYHMLAVSVMRQRDETFRPIYDKCKADFKQTHPEVEVRIINNKKVRFFTPKHIDNAALNRTATFLAKEVWQRVRESIL